MIPIQRLELSVEAQGELKKLAEMVAQVTNPDLKKSKARELFSEKNGLFLKELRSTLKWLNGGSEGCMYCLQGEGNAIDHFEPLSSNPSNAFNWDNYLWACTICNSNHKRHEFPTHDGQPLLINSTMEDPCEYLGLSLISGYFDRIVDEPDEPKKTDSDIYKRMKNNATIDVFKLNTRVKLINFRSSAYTCLADSLLPKYANGSNQAKMDVKEICLSDDGIQLVLTYIWYIKEHSEHAKLLLGENTLSILNKFPEIGTWITPETKASKKLLHKLRSLIGKRVIEINESDNFIEFAPKCEPSSDSRLFLKNMTDYSQDLKGKMLLNFELSQRKVCLHFRGLQILTELLDV